MAISDPPLRFQNLCIDKKLNPKGVIDDIIVSLDSCEYSTDFMILQPKSNLGGHPLILGRPGLAIADAFISCRLGNMTITNGAQIKHISLYPPAKSINELEHVKWLNEIDTNDEIIQ